VLRPFASETVERRPAVRLSPSGRSGILLWCGIAPGKAAEALSDYSPPSWHLLNTNLERNPTTRAPERLSIHNGECTSQSQRWP
jgi:hypothetical protein